MGLGLRAAGNDDVQRTWYGKVAIENGWSLVVLDHQIDLRLYERQALSGKVSNFTRALPAPDSELAQQALKDPYIFDFITARQGRWEHELRRVRARMPRMLPTRTASQALLSELSSGAAGRLQVDWRLSVP